MSNTKLLYLTDSYQKEATAQVTSLLQQGNQTAVSLNQTIFYPQGGGQPSDQGTIQGKHGQLAITQVNYNQGKPLHLGKLTGKLKKGDTVKLKLDWKRRYYNMRLHSAGHVLHEAVMTTTYGLEPIEGQHGIGGRLYLKYKGIIDRTLIPQIQAKANQIIDQDQTITSKLVSLKKLKKEASWIPSNLPNNKPLRIIKISGFDPIPDGGTQVKSTGEIGTIKLTDIDYDNGHSLVHYRLTSPPQLHQTSSSKTNNITDFKKSVTSLNQAALKQIKTSQPSDYEILRIKYLGRHGAINQLTSQIAKLPNRNRHQAGQLVNQLKKEIQQQLSRLKTGTSQTPTDSWLDVTIPGKTPAPGHLHPITQAIEEITHIFESLGFTRVRYPEVDWDYYVFEALNMPIGHPARDEWETFFIDAPKHRHFGEMVLTTHTSNGQVREMERVQSLTAPAGPPIRMLNIAKCYRRQQDVTHTAMFHQFEGLVVDKAINIQHLKGTVEYFAKKYYGPKAKIRLRPFNFEFTEPSFEVDFLCTICQGKTRLANGEKCRLCKSGWLEVAGAGMVHPNVLKAGGINPKQYTGWAFGMGVERAYTLKPGLQLDDIRPFYSNNLNFLEQF